MNNKGLARLEVLKNLNVNLCWKNKELYRLLFNEGFLEFVIFNLNLTISEEEKFILIQSIIFELKKEKFFFSDFKKLKEKIVIHAIFLILHSIYDEYIFSQVNYSSFLKKSHASLMNKLCSWSNKKAFKAEIPVCFNKKNKHKLTSILKEKILDARFINLINKLINSGYLKFEEKTFDCFFHSLKPLKSLLLNIFFLDLDLFMAKISKQYDGKINYVRRENVFLLGISDKEKLPCIDICLDVKKFVKTKYYSLIDSNNFVYELELFGFLFNFKEDLVKLRIDFSSLCKSLKKIRICDNQNIGIAKTSLVNFAKEKVFSYYKRVYKQIKQYYAGIVAEKRLNHVYFLLNVSLAKTLAQKYKISVKKVFLLYGKKLLKV